LSTLAYGLLSKRREETEPVEKRGDSSIDGVKGYVDAVAALVPAEVLAFHALALQFTTDTVESEGEGSVTSEAGERVTTENSESVTVITDPAVLKVVFFALIVAAPLLYVFAHRRKHPGWHRSDWLRMTIPAAAFVAWTMLQKSTAFDAIVPAMADAPRFLIAAAAAVILGLAAQELAYKADGSHP
jgi:hypothetical protein